MNRNLVEQTVGELVRERPSRSRVFEKHGIDFCCGGKRTLTDACARRKISVEAVLSELAAADEAEGSDTGIDFATMPLNTLADHIVTTHHAYLAVELPRLCGMADKVAKVHGDSDERLIELSAVVRGLADELHSHMHKEERVLFPVIRILTKSSTMPNLAFGSIANPIDAMEHEHDTAGNALQTIRFLTGSFSPPESACNTYRALFDGLRELEADLHLHIHKENNILFPRALEWEDALRRATN